MHVPGWPLALFRIAFGVLYFMALQKAPWINFGWLRGFIEKEIEHPAIPAVAAFFKSVHSVLTAARATELYGCFLLDRLDALAQLGGVSRVVAFTPVEATGRMQELALAGVRLIPQRGADLGERLSTLLRELLEDGHAGAIAIDSDSPTLPMAYVVEAARVLAEARCDVVLGPCEDGGYYLIGLRSPQPDLFVGVPWSTDAVFSITLGKASRRSVRPRAATLVRCGHGDGLGAAPYRDDRDQPGPQAHLRLCAGLVRSGRWDAP
jgi:glycosyltransferase A (GT-A) superfamily protein (DUF2064 family)